MFFWPLSIFKRQKIQNILAMVYVPTDDDRNSTWQRSTKRLNTCVKEPGNHSPSEIHPGPLYVCVQWSWPTQSHTRLSIIPNHHLWEHWHWCIMSYGLWMWGCGQAEKVCVCVYSSRGWVKSPQVRPWVRLVIDALVGYSEACRPDLLCQGHSF